MHLYTGAVLRTISTSGIFFIPSSIHIILCTCVVENNLGFSDTILLNRLMSETLVGVIAAHTMQFFSIPLSLSSRKVLRLQLSAVNPAYVADCNFLQVAGHDTLLK